LAALASVLAPRRPAQNDGVIRGQILDVAGKPWADLGIQAVSDQGAKSDTKDRQGWKLHISQFEAGVYTFLSNCRLRISRTKCSAALPAARKRKWTSISKDIASKQGAEYQEAAKEGGRGEKQT